MRHIHKKTGYEFVVGKYDAEDITIISYWRNPEDDVVSPVELVNYYFGDYDAEATDHYIDKWLDNRAKEKRVLQAANDFMDAYLVTNRDVLEGTTIGRLERSLVECGELITNRSWRLESVYPPEWYEAERLKQILNSVMEAPGDTTIKITIERDGRTTTGNLYDHAALVTSLYDSLSYFQSEL